MYDIPQIGLRIRCLFTNTVPTGPYRGAGRPEANYCLERLVDAAARRRGIDRGRVAPAQPDRAGAMPYKTPVGTTYDSGDFAAMFESALERADVAGFPARRAALGEGRASGAGSASRAFSKSPAASPARARRSRFPGESRLVLAIGVQASGQGHATLYRRLAAERLGIPVEQVDFAQGDSDAGCRAPARSPRARRCRSAARSYAAIDAVIEKGRRVAAHVLEAAEADIDYRDGVFEIAGTDRRIALFELAERGRALAREGRSTKTSTPAHRRRAADLSQRLPHRRGRDRSRDRARRRSPPIPRSTIAAACCSRCWSKARCRAASRKGVGQALLEHGVYDDASGQLLAGSFMDYAMPRADDLPPIASALHPVPCTTNPLGVKGVGEAGTTAALAAVMNAIADALPAGAAIDMPATPNECGGPARPLTTA